MEPIVEIPPEPVHGRVKHIEIKIKKIGQLFNSLDPSPFLEKALDETAFEYIVSSVAEHPLKSKQKIVIYMPRKTLRISSDDIKEAIHNHFKYKAMIAERSVRRKIQEGQLSFLIGGMFLALCLFISSIVSANYDTLFSNIIVEGLIISGWVAMWKPISNLLYDWWPAKKENNIYKKISRMDVEIVAY